MCPSQKGVNYCMHSETVNQLIFTRILRKTFEFQFSKDMIFKFYSFLENAF